MIINHSSITSPVYESIKIVEFDLQTGDDHFSIRIELFKCISDPHSFRAHVWRTEFYRIQATFPQSENTGQPADKPSDEIILVDWSSYLSRDYMNFQSSAPESAIQLILDDIQQTLVQTTGKDI